MKKSKKIVGPTNQYGPFDYKNDPDWIYFQKKNSQPPLRVDDRPPIADMRSWVFVLLIDLYDEPSL